MQHVIILSPLYKDEASFKIFAAALETEIQQVNDISLSLLVVNDGTDDLKLETGLPLTIVHLHRNIGHQKAIAIGLAYAHQHLKFDKIIVMDCDGEDKPADVRRLLEKEANDNIVVAKRVRRQEGRKFKLFYYLYKLMFFCLTGKRIGFGNFMLIPAREVNKLVFYSEIWNHLAGAIIKSKLPFRSIDIDRGKRYEGNSNMNFNALLLHGLGSIGVFIEVIASRLMAFSFLLILVAVMAIVAIIYVKVFTDKAIPGWATTTISSMLIVILQSFLLSLFTIFLYLSSQGQRKFIPAHHYQDYVKSVEVHNE